MTTKTAVQKALNTFIAGVAANSSKDDRSLATLAFNINETKTVGVSAKDFCAQSGRMVDAKERSAFLATWLSERATVYKVMLSTRDEITADKSDDRRNGQFAIPGMSTKFTYDSLRSAINVANERAKKIIAGAVAINEVKHLGGKVTLRRDGRLNVEPKGEDVKIATVKQITSAHGVKPAKEGRGRSAGVQISTDNLLTLMETLLTKQDEFGMYTASQQERLVNIHAHLIGMRADAENAFDKVERDMLEGDDNEKIAA